MASSATLPSHRWRLVLGLWLVPTLSGVGLRLALVASFPHSSTSLAPEALACAGGALLDLAVAWLLLLPITAILLLSRATWLDARAVRLGLTSLWIGGCGFLAAAEWFFFAEFTARFNHIVVDYLLYPQEVFVNIWESYPLPAILAALTALSLAAAWPLVGWSAPAAAAPRRLVALAALALGALGAAGILRLVPAMSSNDRIVAGVGQNGLVEMARAFASAHLDYRAFYPTIDPAEARVRAGRLFGFADALPASGRPAKLIGPPASAAATRPLDILVVLEESLGQEFCGCLGGEHAVTTQLDRWSRQGLLLTRLVPTGNRTVRGIEGSLGSFLPLPPESVVKRDQSAGFATIAGVAVAAGYRTEWFYGGAGGFDRMAAFAREAGWQEFRDDGLPGQRGVFPADAFRTAWGVADGHLFDAILTRQLAAQRSGERLFITGLTVSNHQPFLVPGGLSWGTKPVRLVGWIAAAVLLGALTVLALWRWHRRFGWLPTLAVLALGWALWGGYGFHKIGATSMREVAVGYADFSLGRYLDQAKMAGVLDHTVVLIVGDHGARVFGSQEFPLDSYRVPGLFLSPDPRWQGVRLDGLCSQIDLAPTLLSLAGVRCLAPFLGQDLTRDGAPGRAFVQHNRDIGLLTERELVVLGLRQQIDCYRRGGPEGLSLERIPPAAVEADPRLREVRADAVAGFQAAEELYREGRYRLREQVVVEPR